MTTGMGTDFARVAWNFSAADSMPSRAASAVSRCPGSRAPNLMSAASFFSAAILAIDASIFAFRTVVSAPAFRLASRFAQTAILASSALICASSFEVSAFSTSAASCLARATAWAWMPVSLPLTPVSSASSLSLAACSATVLIRASIDVIAASAGLVSASTRTLTSGRTWETATLTLAVSSARKSDTSGEIDTKALIYRGFYQTRPQSTTPSRIY